MVKIDFEGGSSRRRAFFLPVSDKKETFPKESREKVLFSTKTLYLCSANLKKRGSPDGTGFPNTKHQTKMKTIAQNRNRKEYRIVETSDWQHPRYRHMTLREAQRALYELFTDFWGFGGAFFLPTSWGHCVTLTKNSPRYGLQAHTFADGTRSFTHGGSMFRIEEDNYLEQWLVLCEGEYEDKFDSYERAKGYAEGREAADKLTGEYVEGRWRVCLHEELLPAD
jgi:hypothetical protein